MSSLGIEQAKQAKAWFDEHLGGAKAFDLRYFSPLLRTRETAAYLGGEDCGNWIMDDRIVERSWGTYGALSRAEREHRFALAAKMYGQSPWSQSFPAGRVATK